MIEFVIQLVMAVASIFTVSHTAEATPDLSLAAPYLSYTEISVVNASFDGDTLVLEVQGQQPDGCDLPVLVKHEEADNTLRVSIYREVPADLFCTMMLVPYAETLRIDGPFEPALTEIWVNSYKVPLD
jgi:hypothetical protein